MRRGGEVKPSAGIAEMYKDTRAKAWQSRTLKEVQRRSVERGAEEKQVNVGLVMVMNKWNGTGKAKQIIVQEKFSTKRRRDEGDGKALWS